MPRVLSPVALAEALVVGAREELALTPKPGLVDRFDNGSHPNLSFDQMWRSVDLLPLYFQDLLAAVGPGSQLSATSTLARCVEAGRRAEGRMIEAVGSNTHRGYIFLSGLVLLAATAVAADREGDVPTQTVLLHRLRGRIRGLTALLTDIGFQERSGVGGDGRRDSRSHGEEARARHGLAGIRGEARAGLPSVFDHALPALRRHGGHYAMAALMQVVEDTTTVHRCGPAGLERLRADGRRLQELIEHGEAYTDWLGRLNVEYRRLRLTMGGVADCLALAMGLGRWLSEPQARNDR